MAITKNQKSDIVAKVSGVLEKASSVVFVHFKKLSVADTSVMRKTLKAQGVGYYVAKKTLIRLALKDRGYEGEVPELAGEIAIAWSENDPTAPAREVYTFARKFRESITIAGGVFENAFADATKMLAIATIPSLPVLRGMFVNVINAPRQTFVVALDQIAKSKA